MENKMLHVSVSPHIRSGETTQSVMRDVCIALIPALAFGVYLFGLSALMVILVSVVTCVATEWIYQKLMGLPITVSDGSAMVTGMILAMNLPATVPFWIPLTGGVFAILVVKQLFGGLGQNFMNPALAARCFLLLSFSARMTTFPAVDGISSATPLAVLKTGGSVDVKTLFLGLHSGCIGEVSILAILIGAAYLVIRRTIDLRISLTYLASTMAWIFLFGLLGAPVEMSLSFFAAHLFSGGLVAGAFFMATDYVTAPITPAGRYIYGVLLGLLTALFRILGPSAEGVSYAIIIGNTLVPLIERFTVPKPFGKQKVRAAK